VHASPMNLIVYHSTIRLQITAREYLGARRCRRGVHNRDDGPGQNAADPAPPGAGRRLAAEDAPGASGAI
jgi:hypothetical protein